MQKELEELQPQLVETAKENTKMMKVTGASQFTNFVFQR